MSSLGHRFLRNVLKYQRVPRKNYEDNGRFGKCDLQGKLRRKGLVPSGKGTAWRNHSSSLTNFKVSHKDDSNQLYCKAPRDSRRGWLALQQRGFRLDLKEPWQAEMVRSGSAGSVCPRPWRRRSAEYPGVPRSWLASTWSVFSLETVQMLGSEISHDLLLPLILRLEEALCNLPAASSSRPISCYILEDDR